MPQGRKRAGHSSQGRSIQPSRPRQLLAPFSSPGSEVSCRSPRGSASWPRSGQRRCRLRGAGKPAQLPRLPPLPHSRRNPTGVAVRTTCCRFRCGWWPRASSDRERREEKAGGRRTRAASQAADGARRGTKRAAGGSLRERVGVGMGPARAARAGRDRGRARDPPAGRPARPRPAPRPSPARAAGSAYPPRGTEARAGGGASQRRPPTASATVPAGVGRHSSPGEEGREERGRG